MTHSKQPALGPMPTTPRADRDLIGALAADLDQVNYRADPIAELLGPWAIAALDREQAEPARVVVETMLKNSTEQISPEQGLAAVISVWMLGDAVATEYLEAALPTLGVAGAVQLGLGTVVEGRFVPGVDLSVYDADRPGQLWVASDQTALQLRQPLPGGHVLGAGRASLTLAGLVPREPVATALDLGVGCGVQTFHLLDHVRHVTATDISDRALAFTLFNVLLNASMLGVDPAHLQHRLTLRNGSMLEPVAGQRFDLIVSNPPFVIAPAGGPAGAKHTYRQTGATGDAVTEQLIQELPTALTDGGTAVLMANWEIHHDQQWDTRIRQWLPGPPTDSGSDAVLVDAWVIQRDQQDPAGYAETWLADSSDQLDPALFASGYRRYLTDFAQRSVTGIGFGWVRLRRRTTGAATPLRRLESYQGEVHQPVGPVWTQAVNAWDTLQTTDWTQRHARVPYHVTEERYQHFGAEDPEVIMSRQGAGFGRTAILDTATAAVLSVADGQLSLRQIFAAVSGLLGLDKTASTALERAVAQLIVEGFVVLADDGDSVTNRDEQTQSRGEN
ncbi:DUF7059 domain-containing protein [Auritidibacter ignavus]|uniref:DUF7059 domain-containing protein n=1 Tax=Auritidibacter ignavus TaxID=678932 RepID=UPI0024BB1008|nr:methyltransferase [Auritidibacter ignavus]WHS28619.1 methyltransferase [Auritidibacter ignavus]